MILVNISGTVTVRLPKMTPVTVRDIRWNDISDLTLGNTRGLNCQERQQCIYMERHKWTYQERQQCIYMERYKWTYQERQQCIYMERYKWTYQERQQWIYMERYKWTYQER